MHAGELRGREQAAAAAREAEAQRAREAHAREAARLSEEAARLAEEAAAAGDAQRRQTDSIAELQRQVCSSVRSPGCHCLPSCCQMYRLAAAHQCLPDNSLGHT